MRKSLMLAVASALALSGCAPALQEAPARGHCLGADSNGAPASQTTPVEAGWWESFGDHELSRFVEQARLNNPDVHIAAARVEEARATEMGSRGYLLPSVGAGVEGGVQREVSPFGTAQDSIAAQPAFRASYEVDLFGKNAARVDAAEAGVAASAADEEAARLSVSAATASGYITLLALDKRLAVLEATLEARDQALNFARDRAEVGYTSQLELRQAEAEYQATAQLVPQLEAQIARQENALSVLTGELPSAIERGGSWKTCAVPRLPAPFLPSSFVDVPMLRRQNIASPQPTRKCAWPEPISCPRSTSGRLPDLPCPIFWPIRSVSGRWEAAFLRRSSKAGSFRPNSTWRRRNATRPPGPIARPSSTLSAK